MFLWVTVFLLVCIILTIIRILLGPTATDRLVGTDMLSNLVVFAMVMIGFAFNEVIYIDVAIVYALLSFVTTLFVAKYIGGGKF